MSGNAVRLLAGPDADVGFDANLSTISDMDGLAPFSAAAEAFIADVSSSILRARDMRAYPELMAMAHALRPAQIATLKTAFEARNAARIRRPAGMTFHIAPSNVDSIFVYSWFLALLGGNSNVVRLSSRLGDQVDRLIDALTEILAKPDHADIRARTLLVSYDRDDAVTADISRRCAIRVLWGGDATVEHVRTLPLNPRAREIAFADRFSLALLGAEAVVNASDEELKRLIDDFFNDAFWFDQNACSSPRLLVWLGDTETCGQAQTKFWRSLDSKLGEMDWTLAPATMVARMTAVQSFAARRGVAPVTGGWSAQDVIRIPLAKLDADARQSHPGSGVFYEFEIPAVEALDSMLNPRDQTLCVFGVPADRLTPWLTTRTGPGIDRVVPVGHALDFSSVWDGQDLLDIFTTEVAFDPSI